MLRSLSRTTLSSAASVSPRISARPLRRGLSSQSPDPTDATAAASSTPVKPAQSSSQGMWSRISHKDAERRSRADEKREVLRNQFSQLSSRSMKEHLKSGGKPYLTPLTLAHPYTARVVPNDAVAGVTFAGEHFSLPKECSNYAATLVTVAHNQQSMDFADRWLEPLTIVYPQDGSQRDVRCLQLSVLSNALISLLFGSYLRRSQAAHCDEAKRARVAVIEKAIFDPARTPSTFVQPPAVVDLPNQRGDSAAKNAAAAGKGQLATPAELGPARTALAAEPGWSVANPLLLHLFLIDSASRIRWRAVGPPQDEDLATLQRVTDALVEEQRAAATQTSAQQQPKRSQGGGGGRRGR